jgi:riboflavin synthase
MFTGLIEEVGKVVRVERGGEAARLSVATTLPAEEIQLGDSVAVNGVCLTVVALSGNTVTFDVSPETLERTAFRALRPGSPVNLERALRLSDRLGGHIVSGHVDCVATLAERREVSGNIVFGFTFPREFARYVVEKGSIAVDGISLTVNRVSAVGFAVNVIPHTADRTTLREKAVGDAVNIEVDILAKYVERLLSGGGADEKSGLTLDLLAKSGFM